MPDTIEFLARRMADPSAQWSIGTFGAIAEFVRDPDEPVRLDTAGPIFTARTERGAIRIAPREDLRIFAAETPTKESWSQVVALCLPEDACAMSGRTVLTEIGPDVEALREEDRDAVLFDLGLGALQTDLCIRTSDPALLETLRACAGRPVFDPGNPVMGAIVPASPHRVFVSRIGRVEVFQPIPPAHGKSPEGPHTHVLPKLLAHRRTHPATQPVPAGYVPCAHCYPEHPAKDAMGEPRPFDRDAHLRFQHILQRFGDPDLIALKQDVAVGVAKGSAPSEALMVNKRFARASVRVALRQLAAEGVASAALAAWSLAHDAPSHANDEATADPYGH